MDRHLSRQVAAQGQVEGPRLCHGVRRPRLQLQVGALHLREEAEPRLYDEIFKKIFLPVRKSPPGGGRALRANEDMWIAQDNDPKQKSWMTWDKTDKFLKKNKIEMVTSPKLAVDGSVDNHQNTHGCYAMNQPREDAFPEYSNDINWVIEKAWRELAYRCMSRWRNGDIKGWVDHIRVIKEEWAGLEFEETKRDGRVWKGINWYVENWDEVLKEVSSRAGGTPSTCEVPAVVNRCYAPQ